MKISRYHRRMEDFFFKKKLFIFVGSSFVRIGGEYIAPYLTSTNQVYSNQHVS